MDMQTPVLFYPPTGPHTGRKGEGHGHPRALHTGKRKSQKEAEEPLLTKKGRQDGQETKPGGKTVEKNPRKMDQVVLHTVKKEPDPAQDTETGPDVKPNVKDMEPDVKLNIGALHNKEESESFMSRIAKGSGQILIEEYSTTDTPKKSCKSMNLRIGTPGKQSKQQVQHVKQEPPQMIANESVHVPHDNKRAHGRYPGAEVPQGNDDIVDNGSRQNEDNTTTNNDLQKYRVDANEHPKRKHKFGIDPELIRWLSEDPLNGVQLHHPLSGPSVKQHLFVSNNSNNGLPDTSQDEPQPPLRHFICTRNEKITDQRTG